MKEIFIIKILILFAITIFSQDTINNKFIILKHENGIISSEGYLNKGKPDGYWKSYNKKGVLISEGNRSNYLLDSVWKFYNDDSSLKMIVNYKNGKKEGLKTTFLDNEKVEEYYIEDIKNKNEIHFSNGKIKSIIPFVDGLEEGVASEYDTLGNIIQLTHFSKGFISKREYINRTDNFGMKQGLWKIFYDNQILKTETNYLNNKRNGIHKEFDIKGNVIKIEKYINDVLISDAKETKKLETKKEYHKNGKIKVIATFYNGVAEGNRREYDESGKNIKSYIFSSGIIVGNGVIDDYGNKQGMWTEYYDGRFLDSNDNSIVRARGRYKNSKPIGEWKYYLQNGKLEQIGGFDEKGRQDGKWLWYYPNDSVLMEINFDSGKKEGEYIEFDVFGNVLVKGNYIEDFEDGEWFRINGNFIEKGKYVEGKREGYWKGYYLNNNQISYESVYNSDNPDGRYVQYWENGSIKEIGNYLLGKKNGLWQKFDEQGNLYLTETYKNGQEIRYDGIKVLPKLDDTHDE